MSYIVFLYSVFCLEVWFVSVSVRMYGRPMYVFHSISFVCPHVPIYSMQSRQCNLILIKQIIKLIYWYCHSIKRSGRHNKPLRPIRFCAVLLLLMRINVTLIIISTSGYNTTQQKCRRRFWFAFHCARAKHSTFHATPASNLMAMRRCQGETNVSPQSLFLHANRSAYYVGLAGVS